MIKSATSNRFTVRISEKTGRGIPTIVNAYGNDSIMIEDRTITVIIPFNRIFDANYQEGNKEGNKNLNTTQLKVLTEIRNNPNITKKQLETNV